MTIGASIKRWVIATVATATIIVRSALGLPVRPVSTQTIATMNNTRVTNIVDSIGGQSSTVDGPDFGLMIQQAILVYQDAIGQIAYVILFSTPFIMMWISNADTTLPGIVGWLFALFVFLYIPDQYHIFAIGAMIISTAAIIYGLYHRSW